MHQIIYWSGTGNTEKMAKYIGSGIEKGGKPVSVKQVYDVRNAEVEEASLLVLGCPSMGCEELEDLEMAPFIESLEGKIAGRKVALFGSYGWGSGEWMENFKKQMEGYDAKVVMEPLIINEFTSGQDEAICESYGEALARL